MGKEMTDNFAQWRFEFTFPEKGIRETVLLGKKENPPYYAKAYYSTFLQIEHCPFNYDCVSNSI